MGLTFHIRIIKNLEIVKGIFLLSSSALIRSADSKS